MFSRSRPGRWCRGSPSWVDGHPVEGEVLPADRAREIYLDYLRQHRDPALLEYVGRDTFQARVFPIPLGGTRRIELEYTELLTPEGGVYRYRYPLDTERFSYRPLEEVKIEVELSGKAPLGAVYSPSHKVTVLRPEPTRAAARYILKHLGEEDRFGLIAFNEEVDRLTEGLVEATSERIAAAVAEVERIYADGWTNIHGTLLSTSERPKYVIFLTDGLPTAGETDTGRIVRDVTAANAAGARLLVFGVGYDVDPQLLGLLAQKNRAPRATSPPRRTLKGCSPPSTPRSPGPPSPTSPWTSKGSPSMTST
ncbi:MAG TPA: VWA domain-containing protein, partial [Candidatus Acetothermia bacterium]|nr:VWA domain-containing protein [Candidatus Acetothermia bacterium]